MVAIMLLDRAVVVAGAASKRRSFTITSSGDTRLKGLFDLRRRRAMGLAAYLAGTVTQTRGIGWRKKEAKERRGI